MELISPYLSALTSILSKYFDQHTHSWVEKLLITALNSIYFILYNDGEKCIANKSNRVKKEKDYIFFSVARGGDRYKEDVPYTASCNFSLSLGFRFPDQSQPQLPEFFKTHSY